MRDSLATVWGDVRIGLFVILISFLIYILQWNLSFHLNVIIVSVLLLSVCISRSIIYIFFLLGWLVLVKYTQTPSLELLVIGGMGISTYIGKRFFISPSKYGIFLMVLLTLFTILFWVFFGPEGLGSSLFFLELISSLAYAMILYGGIVWLRKTFI